MAVNDSIREDLVGRIGKMVARTVLAYPAGLGTTVMSVVETTACTTAHLMLHAASVHLDPEVNEELVEEIRTTIARVEELDGEV
jgi:glyceraldehyde-3-phosphate dehydrogenase/erythrose-4-phosphate dehydrogenase